MGRLLLVVYLVCFINVFFVFDFCRFFFCVERLFFILFVGKKKIYNFLDFENYYL